jgi:putative peptidoglycan lipid II flippase
MTALWKLLQTTVAGGAILIGTASVLSRIAGLIRDFLLASHFGAGRTLDMYNEAFLLPDFIFKTMVLGALSSSFIPIFLEYWMKEGEEGREEAWRVANGVLNTILLGAVTFAIIVFVFAGPIIARMAPGFTTDEVKITADLTRIMLVSMIFFAVSNVVSSILNALRKFISYGLAPIFYNLGIIMGIIVLVPLFGIQGLAIGVVLGAFLHLAVQVPSLIRTGFHLHGGVGWSHPGVHKILMLMAPRSLGLAIQQLSEFVAKGIGSTLAAGSISVYNFANNLLYFPISVFGISLAVSVFPVFTEVMIRKDHAAFVHHFSKTVRRILVVLVPISVLTILLRAQIVRLIYGAGRFDWDDTSRTAAALGVFAISLAAQGLIPVLARSFYALKDTVTPVGISVIAFVINVVLSFLLAPLWSVSGLAFAFSVSGLLQLILLYSVLRKRLGPLDDRRVFESLLRIIFASFVMGIATRGMMELLSWVVNMQTRVGLFLQTSGAVVTAVLIYLAIAYWQQFDELTLFWPFLQRLKKYFFGNAVG